MFWYDKHQKNTLYIDNRRTDGGHIPERPTHSVNPDVLMDFRELALRDESFQLVVFDPPHIIRDGIKGIIGKKYGVLDSSWPHDIRRGFSECWRVLKPGGVLIFKWSEVEIPLSEVLDILPVGPLFGNRVRGSNTVWLCFMKLEESYAAIC